MTTPNLRYGYRCACHGMRLFADQRERDKHAITYQCKLEMFRVEWPVFQHARDIPDTTFLRAVYAASRRNVGDVALRGEVTRLLGGVSADAATHTDEIPGVPWKVVLAKFRRVKGRGLVRGCDCGCRGDWELTHKGRRVLLLATILNCDVTGTES